MIIYLALLIPIVVSIIFYIFYKREFTWWEFFIPIATVFVVITITKAVINKYMVTFPEYWGSTVTAVFESEPYNYWQHQTCTRTISTGKTTTVVTYDCSHQENVAPKWYAVTDLKEEIRISEKLYDKLAKQFNTERIIVKKRKNYDPKDRCVGSKGTKFEGQRVGKYSYVYEVKWNGTDNTRKGYVSKHLYRNKIKASDLSIFNISIVSENLADSLGLFDYPEYSNEVLAFLPLFYYTES